MSILYRDFNASKHIKKIIDKYFDNAFFKTYIHAASYVFKTTKSGYRYIMMLENLCSGKSN